MSNKDRTPPPPSSRVPVNLEGIQIYEVEGITIGSWCPLPDGKGLATQVHMMLKVPAIPFPLVVRFKSPHSLDQLIGSLERHRDDVWPEPDSKKELK